MAQFFAWLLAIIQAAPAASPPALDARWAITFDSAPVATPGYDADTAYVPLKDGELVAVDLNRGTIRWRHAIATTFTPATGSGLVFIVANSTIEARDARNGEVRWRASLPGGAAMALSYDTGWLIASTPAGDLIAMRASDGQSVWRRQLGAALSGAPGAALDRLYLPLADNRLVSLLLADGTAVWERTLPARVTALLALDDQLVVGTAGKRLLSLDLRNGRERWAWTVGGDISGVPVADEKRIYFAARDNVLRAIDRGSGNLRWKANLPSRPAGGPLRLPEVLLMPLVSNEIQGFEPETGKAVTTVRAAGEIGTQPFFRASARLVSPSVIAVSREGQLQGFGRRFEPPPQALPVPLPGAPALP